MTHFNLRKYFCIILLCLSNSTFAMQPISLHDIEFSVATGFNWMRSKNTDLTVSPVEIDSVNMKRISNPLIWKVGAGYDLFANTCPQRNFFNRLLLELNVYRSGATISGDVWQFQSAEFNNYNFRAPITSTRLMFDVKPSLFTYQCISPYAILGIGIAWNTAAYRETLTDTDVDPLSYNILSNRTMMQTAYDIGAGLRVDITQNVGASLEYLYTNLGKATSANASATVARVSTQPTFTLRSQSVLLGISWKI
jgi:opacity protein-like surface antigen